MSLQMSHSAFTEWSDSCYLLRWWFWCVNLNIHYFANSVTSFTHSVFHEKYQYQKCHLSVTEAVRLLLEAYPMIFTLSFCSGLLTGCSCVGDTLTAGANAQQLHGNRSLGQENICSQWSGPYQCLVCFCRLDENWWKFR